MSSATTRLSAPLTADDVRSARFRTTKFREGYDRDEVDRLMERVVTALTEQASGGRPVISADDVLSAKFQATKFREGYDQDDVDDFLDEVIRTMRPDGVSGSGGTAPSGRALGAHELRLMPLRRTRLGARYEVAEVDAFVSRAAVALDERDQGRSPSLRADDVRTTRFGSPSGLGVGYDGRQVDDLLRTVAGALGTTGT